MAQTSQRQMRALKLFFLLILLHCKVNTHHKTNKTNPTKQNKNNKTKSTKKKKNKPKSNAYLETDMK